MMFCKTPKSAKEIGAYLGISSKRYINYKVIRPLIDKVLLEYRNKDAINAKNQKYIANEKRGK